MSAGDCPTCGGDGVIVTEPEDIYAINQRTIRKVCPTCHGDGVVEYDSLWVRFLRWIGVRR